MLCTFFLSVAPPPTSPLFPYTTLFRSEPAGVLWVLRGGGVPHDFTRRFSSQGRAARTRMARHRGESAARIACDRDTAFAAVPGRFWDGPTTRHRGEKGPAVESHGPSPPAAPGLDAVHAGREARERSQ